MTDADPDTRTLVLLRHAKAEQGSDAADDAERPLSARGTRRRGCGWGLVGAPGVAARRGDLLDGPTHPADLARGGDGDDRFTAGGWPDRSSPDRPL